ncbi:hypothetical protein [Catelliglobosispora koreensis]|uniref:hypothetical protein n=1 Tax=Catelliglobosispora koreensis TaxID=129052 RepID=UPI0003762C90|nr:hypothetical protein [Catelliglobosispora koreensis]
MHPSLDELKSTVLGPAPKLRDVIADAPRLAGGIRSLEEDRRALLAAFDVLDHEQLATKLKAFRQRAADLLYQAYAVDLGGET